MSSVTLCSLSGVAPSEYRRTAPGFAVQTSETTVDASNETDDSIDCGDNLRNQTAESGRENAAPLPAIQPNDARVSDLPLCTRPQLVQPLRANNQYANAGMLLIQD